VLQHLEGNMLETLALALKVWSSIENVLLLPFTGT